MKSLIVAFVFAIGLMLALPDPSSGSCSPPDQVSFVVEQIAIAPAIAFVQENTFVVEYSQLALVPEFIEGQEKGGCTIEKSLNTYLGIGYSNKNVIVKAPDFIEFCNYDFRLYRPLMVYQSHNLIQKNIAVVHRFPRDGLTQV